MAKVERSFGEWASPITSRVATDRATVISEVRVESYKDAETVYWLELRYGEGGRYVIVSKGYDTSVIVEWTPKGMNARTSVHEYGGGSYFVCNGTVYFSNFPDQRLYMQSSPDSPPIPVTAADTHCRYADGVMSQGSGKIYIVCEDHSKVKAGQTKEPESYIVCIDPVSQRVTVMCSGADFYSSPRISKEGDMICWLQWFHPNMPWDSTELWTASLSDSGSLISDTARKVVWGNDLNVMQPSWTPDNQLLYITDETDWWNIYKRHADGTVINVYPTDAEIGGPSWHFGCNPYATNNLRPDDLVLACKERLLYQKGSASFVTLETGFTGHSYIGLSLSGKVYCLASSPVKFSSIICVDPSNGHVDVIRESQVLDIPRSYFAIPREIKFPTADGAIAYGVYYPPTNPDFSASQSELPPLLVKAHGGPTAACKPFLNLSIQYFTSRGFVVLDVNYRGSTGYGRKYRNMLRDRWGICDVEDCCAGALYLVEQKLVDPNKLCIDGGSAGGYTTLACLAFKDVFKAGASHYGVADLGLLALETHKFESRYMDSLVGLYPQRKDIYDSRSPINHIQGFNAPIIFFQGDQDKVVPPNQAQMMYKSVFDKGLTCALVMFEGEQHGFRKSENMQTALDGELYFFSKIFGFTPPDIDVADRVVIENL